MEAAYGLVVRLTLAPGREGAFDRAAAEAVGRSVGEAAPLVHACHAVAGDPSARLLYELHADRAAYEAHRARPDVRRRLADLWGLAESVETTVLVPAIVAGARPPAGDDRAAAGLREDDVVPGTTFGERIAVLRRRHGLSQRALAESIDRSESWMSQVERDILPVGRLAVLQRLAAALGVSIYDLEPAGLAPPPAGHALAARPRTGPA